jgi:hypothetical protein
MTYRLSTSQLLALLELSTRGHLLLLQALGIPWTRKVTR